MPEIDLTVTVSVIIALCAIISPVITTIINNLHEEKMKKIEYRHTEKSNREEHEKSIYEGYVRSAGKCIYSQSPEDLKMFGEHSTLILYSNLDETVKRNIVELQKNIKHGDKEQNLNLLVKIAQQLNQSRINDTQEKR